MKTTIHTQAKKWILTATSCAALVGLLAACDTRTPEEKASDGMDQIGRGEVSDGMRDVGEAVEDATDGNR